MISFDMARTELKDRGEDEIPYQLQQNLKQLAADLVVMAGNELPPERTSIKWKEEEISYEARMERKNGEFFPLSFEADFREKDPEKTGKIKVNFNKGAEIKEISLTGTHLSLLGNLIPPDTISCSISLENLDFTNPQGIKFQVSRKKLHPSFKFGGEESSSFIKPRDLLFLIAKIRIKLIPS